MLSRLPRNLIWSVMNHSHTKSFHLRGHWPKNRKMLISIHNTSTTRKIGRFSPGIISYCIWKGMQASSNRLCSGRQQWLSESNEVQPSTTCNKLENQSRQARANGCRLFAVQTTRNYVKATKSCSATATLSPARL